MADASQDSPRTLWRASASPAVALAKGERAAGKRPGLSRHSLGDGGRFSPRPFCGAGEKDKRRYCFLHYCGLRSAAAAWDAATAELAALLLGIFQKVAFAAV